MLIRRPNPNFAITWTLTVAAPLQITIGAWALLALDPPHWLLLALLAAAVNWTLATLDARRVQTLPHRAATNPPLAAASPLLYLLIRALHDPDPRAGRPFWAAVAATPVALFFLTIAVLGRYAATVHGY